MHCVNITELQSKINKALEKGEAASRYTDDVNDNIEELKLCKEILNSSKLLRGGKLNFFSALVDETLNELRNKIKDLFNKKKEESVEEIVSPYMDNNDEERFEGYCVQTPLDDLKDELEGLEALLPADEVWSEDLIRKTRYEVALAQAKRDLARKKRKRGAKVKRVPPREGFDAADVAAELGMEDLAKELTVEYPKPFVNTKKEGPVTKREYFVKTTGDIDVQNSELKELLEKAFSKKSDVEDTSTNVEDTSTNVEDTSTNVEDTSTNVEDTSKKLKAVLNYEKNKPRERFDSKRIKNAFDKGFNTEAVSAFYECKHTDVNSLVVVEYLERLVGTFTTEKLAAERKLALAELALKEANENLRTSNVKEALGVPKTSSTESIKDNIKRDLEEAFRGRTF